MREREHATFSLRRPMETTEEYITHTSSIFEILEIRGDISLVAVIPYRPYRQSLRYFTTLRAVIFLYVEDSIMVKEPIV